MTDYSKFIPTPKEWPAASPPPPAVEAQELIAEHMKLVDAYAVAYRAGEPVKDAYHAVQESARRLSKQPLVDPARSSAHATACPTSEQRSLDAVDAARYRWLVENSFDREDQTQLHIWLHWEQPHSQTGEPTEWKCRVRGPAIDRVIDDAMSQPTEKD